jgi:hypothetical protein
MLTRYNRIEIDLGNNSYRISDKVAMKKNKQELILKVGAVGGTISLWSVNAKDGTRSFVVKTDESYTQGSND